MTTAPAQPATAHHTADELLDAYAHCASVVRRRARNFYHGLRLTPEPRRSAIYSVYAWMRRADDETDNAGSPGERLAALARLREQTEHLLRTGQPALDDPVSLAFAGTFRSYNLDPHDLRLMLDALEGDARRDAEPTPAADAAVNGDEAAAPPTPVFDSRAELRAYCDGVASSVGRTCVRVWGLVPDADERRAMHLASRRGVAFQLTNILRDVAEDYDEGRVYLPREDFARAGVAPEELRAWRRPDACAGLIASVAGWARAEYDGSRELESMIDPACRPTLRAMTRIYSGLLAIVERDPSRVAGDRRIRLQSVRKVSIALRAALAARAASALG